MRKMQWNGNTIPTPLALHDNVHQPDAFSYHEGVVLYKTNGK